MKAVVIIPARYASTRFPGKPLAPLGGKPILQRVWESLYRKVTDADCFIATDDERIADVAESSFGANVVMTSASCQSGTDRCGEVVSLLAEDGHTEYDIVVNVQGDEPFIRPRDVENLLACFDDPEVQIATLCRRIDSEEDLLSPNCVKVVCDASGHALYFSRQAIPFFRDVPQTEWLERGLHYKHIGMYAFRNKTLLEVCKLPQSRLERAEKLEQLRWLEAGYRIAVAETDYDGVGIDTPADLARAEKKWNTITHCQE